MWQIKCVPEAQYIQYCMTVEINIIGNSSYTKRAEIKEMTRTVCAARLSTWFGKLLRPREITTLPDCLHIYEQMWHCIAYLHLSQILGNECNKTHNSGSINTTSNKTLGLHTNNKKQTYKMNKVLGIDLSVIGGILRKKKLLVVQHARGARNKFSYLGLSRSYDFCRKSY